MRLRSTASENVDAAAFKRSSSGKRARKGAPEEKIVEMMMLKAVVMRVSPFLYGAGPCDRVRTVYRIAENCSSDCYKRIFVNNY